MVDIFKKLSAQAKERRRRGDEGGASKTQRGPAHGIFVSQNWKSVLETKPRVAPKAAAKKDAPPVAAGAQDRCVALDCEMVGVGPDGTRSVVARASVVDHEGKVLLDVFVRPQEKVTDYRTHITGIKPETLRGSKVLAEADARSRVAAILQGKILVGHALQNDLEALRMDHPHALIRDTSLFRPFRPAGAEKRTPSLKRLAEIWLHETIQTGTHDSVEDARAALRLYLLRRREWEKNLKSTMRLRTGVAAPTAAVSGGAEEDDGERVDQGSGAPAGREGAAPAPAHRKKKRRATEAADEDTAGPPSAAPKRAMRQKKAA